MRSFNAMRLLTLSGSGRRRRGRRRDLVGIAARTHASERELLPTASTFQEWFHWGRADAASIRCRSENFPRKTTPQASGCGMWTTRMEGRAYRVAWNAQLG